MTNESANSGRPPAVDRTTFQAELDKLRAREKTHTREGDAIAAARRRLAARARVAGGRPIPRRTSRPVRPVTSWRVARKDDAVTSASTIVNSVAKWVSVPRRSRAIRGGMTVFGF